MDTVSAVCIVTIAIVGLIIFFSICIYVGDAIAHRVRDYEEI